MKISVIIPTHDRPDGLAVAVDSILAQTRRPHELIIINDGQTPLPESLGDTCRRAGVELHCRQRETASLTASRNMGMDIAAGDVIVMMEDDATLGQDFLKRIAELFQADVEEKIAAIGPVITEPHTENLSGWVWGAMADALGHARWNPRRCPGRYFYSRLPSALRGRLLPTGRLNGAGMSIRRKWATRLRFAEALKGYAFGEDREFSFRLGREAPIFRAPELTLIHRPGSGGRINAREKGRMYVVNSLYIARNSVEGGAGTAVLIAYDFAGTILLYLLWSLWGKNARVRLAFALGMVAELARQAKAAVGRLLCGC